MEIESTFLGISQEFIKTRIIICQDLLGATNDNNNLKEAEGKPISDQNFMINGHYYSSHLISSLTNLIEKIIFNTLNLSNSSFVDKKNHIPNQRNIKNTRSNYDVYKIHYDFGVIYIKDENFIFIYFLKLNLIRLGDLLF